MVVPALSISRRNLAIIIGLIIVGLAIPVTIYLLRQRQELRKRAEVALNTVTDRCNWVALGPTSENYNPNTHTYTLTVPLKNKTSNPLSQVKLEWKLWYCRSKDVAICDQNRQVSEEEINLGAGEQKTLQKNVVQKLGYDCGSLQIDLVVKSIGGDTSCGTDGNWADLIWGLYRTGKDCEEVYSPPGEHPSCSALDGPSSAAPGDIVTLTAHPSGGNLDSVEFWLISKENINTHGLCPESEWAPRVWTLIDDDTDKSDGWSAQWNTTGYEEGQYFIAANVNGLYGEEKWWCTGNPEGPCNDDPKGVSCSDCSRWISLAAKTPTPPTPPAVGVPDTAFSDPLLTVLFLGITLILLGAHVIL